MPAPPWRIGVDVDGTFTDLVLADAGGATWVASVVSSSFRRIVSPAPPSNSTLSGTTTAARPVVLSMVRMCWTKLNCLFEVVAQKSCRL